MRAARRRIGPALAGLALLAAACSDEAEDADAGRDSTETRHAEAGQAWIELGPDDDIYALAEGLEPGGPGEVVAVQQLAAPGLDGTLLRVLHHSESLEGDDIAVSGLILVPEGPIPDGGRPVLSLAHGTTGIADRCAPSRRPDAAMRALATPFLERGMVVVATDYEGLGTPAPHPYLVGESEGRGVLDIVRAAQELGDDVGASGAVVIWGHSQGGHAALFANEIAAAWAPELQMVGTVAGAPPSQLPLIAAALENSPFHHFLAMVAAGWAAAYPDADPALVLTDAGLERLPVVDELCAGDLAAHWGDLSYDELVKADPAKVEPWASLLVENDPGFRVGAAPALIVHGDQDELIPVVSSELLVTRMCERGQVVQRLVYEGQGHAGVIGSSMSDVLAWIDARLAGQPAPDDCAAKGDPAAG